jgi:hypothetical protein
MRSDRELREFLTGGLDEARYEAIEQEALGNRDLFDQLAALEDELIVDCARGLLPPAEQRWLETHTLAAAGGDARLRDARIMLSALDGLADDTPRRSFVVSGFAWVALAAAAVVVLALGIDVWRLRRDRDEAREQLAAARLEVQRLAASQSNPVAPPAVPDPPPASVIAIVLTPGLVRGTTAPATITRPADPAATLEFQLTLPPTAKPSEAFQFALMNADGRRVATGMASLTDGRAVARVPARDVPADDYEIVLSAAGTEIAAYSVSVRQPR